MEEGEPEAPGSVERGAGDDPEGEKLQVDRDDSWNPTGQRMGDQPGPEEARRVVLDHLRGDLGREAVRVEIGDEFTPYPLFEDPARLPHARHAVGQQDQALRAG